MASTAQEGLASVEELDVVVDADAHTSEGVGDLLAYLDDRYAGVERILRSSRSSSYDVFSKDAASPNRFPEGNYGAGEGGFEEYTIAQKLDEAEDFDIDYALVLTNLLAVNTINDDRISVALADAYNRWLADNFLDHGKVKGGIVVSSCRPDLAAEAIDEWADHPDMVAVGFPNGGLTHLPGHEFYDPIYGAAEDNDLPVVFHPSTAGMSVEFPNLYRRCRTWAVQHVMGHPFTNMAGLTSLMLEGTPEKFPDLQFLFQEAGLGWVPFLKLRLDDHYLEYAEEIPYLDGLPSEYLREQFSFTTQPLGHTAERPEHLAWLIDIVGAESVMYSADLPHADFDPPEELFGRINGYFGPEEVRAVMGENAVEVFDL